jgi:predicted Holliday junction resolvase-like endonuclease
MLTTSLLILVAVLATLAGFYYYKSRELPYYKDLFKLASAEQKKTNEELRELLSKINAKDVLLERSAQALESTLNSHNKLEKDNLTMQEALTFQEAQFKTLMRQKKSSEVRTGKITEQISPFLQDYPCDPATARFIGDPIDLVHFDKDKITFVEVKSGKSQLSTKQRGIRDLIKEGKVEFVLYRIEGKEDGSDKS